MPASDQLLDAAEQEFRRHCFTAGADLVWDAACQSVAGALHANLPRCNEQEAHDVATILEQRPLDQATARTATGSGPPMSASKA